MLLKPNPYKKEKKQEKKKNEEKVSENKPKKKKFTIWEEIPDEPRDSMQLEASELINQDGYYNTINPVDADKEIAVDTGFNWKIPALILFGIIGIGASVAFMFFF